jgi:GTP-binding protein HflX
VVSIIGYTNSGKSTLFNSLTNARVLSEDKLFATLDPTTRRLRFPENREILLTDTVGFIHDLPRELVAAFKSTLEELNEADLLIHLIDVSEEGYEDRVSAVNKILSDLGLSEKDQMMVFNKADRVDAEEARATAAAHAGYAISALNPKTASALLADIDERLFFSGVSRA